MVFVNAFLSCVFFFWSLDCFQFIFDLIAIIGAWFCLSEIVGYIMGGSKNDN